MTANTKYRKYHIKEFYYEEVNNNEELNTTSPKLEYSIFHIFNEFQLTLSALSTYISSISIKIPVLSPAQMYSVYNMRYKIILS